MVQLRVRGDDRIQPSNAVVPEKRPHDSTPDIEALILSASVDQHDLPIRQFNHSTVSLTDIQKTNLERNG